jgi:hypothetical protein
MLAQMAATAGSVAVGSTIGHGLSSMLFGGGGREVPVEQQQPQAPPMQQYQAQNSGLSCDFQAKGELRLFECVLVRLMCCTRTEFTKCLETNDVNACGWYLEQLKAVSRLSFFARRTRADCYFRSVVPGSCAPLLDGIRLLALGWTSLHKQSNRFLIFVRL